MTATVEGGGAQTLYRRQTTEVLVGFDDF